MISENDDFGKLNIDKLLILPGIFAKSSFTDVTKLRNVGLPIERSQTD